MFLDDKIQSRLRELKKINENEVVEKKGDIYVAINVLSGEKRVLEDKSLIESLSLETSNTLNEKKILKG